jgi:hypothetical protein
MAKEKEQASERDWGSDRGEIDPDKEYLCIVHRVNTEKENADFPIIVSLVGKKRRVVSPGEKARLFGYHILILRDSVNETEISVPSESAVYESKDPLKAAEQNFPGFRAIRNEDDGTITLLRHSPRYSVEVIRPIS